MFDASRTKVFMPTLLHIDSSPRYKSSVTRELSAAFVADWKALHPGCSVLERDLTTTPIAPIDESWIGAAYTRAEMRTPEQTDQLIPSEALVAELEQATEYVVGVPMHNFNIPSVLKLWIDQIARLGRTFVFEDGRPKGLLVDKKATIIIATGQTYEAQTPMASLNFVEPYLRSIFRFLGVTDASVLTVGNAGVLNRGQEREAFLAPYLQAVKARVRSSAEDHRLYSAERASASAHIGVGELPSSSKS